VFTNRRITRMNRGRLGPLIVAIVIIALPFVWLPTLSNEIRPQVHGEETSKVQSMNLQVPMSLKTEHEELHAQLAKAIRSGGSTGSAAKTVSKLLHPHFVKEEEYALPPLGLLLVLAEGKEISDKTAVLAMTDKLKAELPRMLEEHKAVVAALKRLANAARKEGKTQYIHFSEKLILHARNEEEVLYPAAVLIGEYLKLQSNKQGRLEGEGKR
jgi:hypothetical protein